MFAHGRKRDPSCLKRGVFEGGCALACVIDGDEGGGSDAGIDGQASKEVRDESRT